MTATLLQDRLSGAYLNVESLKDPLSEGRYQLIQPLHYGRHSRLEVGSILLDTGSAGPVIQGKEVKFARPQLTEQGLDKLALAFKALADIDSRLQLEAGDWPSPLLPSELGQEGQSSELERLLAQVFEDGHLDHIAARPRLNMRYDREVLPIARAHRLDSAFERHLSAHSEHWAARTVTGLVPRAVLAQVSEDDPNIYEHRVYAELLNRLERYLRKQINQLKSISDLFKEARKLQGDRQEIYHRTARNIYEVWGEAVGTAQADELLSRNAAQRRDLDRQLRHIRQLKQRPVQELDGCSLYHAIPRNANVETRLVPTNLLSHDPHYRQLRLLWQACLKALAIEREHPAQVLERRLAEQARYERYVGLLVVRSLDQLGFTVGMNEVSQRKAFNPLWNEHIELTLADHAWILAAGDRRLRLIPVAVALDQKSAPVWQTRLDGGELRVPCVLQLPPQLADQPPCRRLRPGGAALQLTPLDLYTEEVMITLLSAWLWQGRVVGYGEPFRRPPRAVEEVWHQGGGRSDGRIWVLDRPVPPHQWHPLQTALEQHANRELEQRVSARKHQIDRLSRCPVCGQGADFRPSDRGFYARCDCDGGWEWRLQEGRFTLKSRRYAEQVDFQTLGRYWIEVYQP